MKHHDYFQVLISTITNGMSYGIKPIAKKDYGSELKRANVPEIMVGEEYV